MLFIQIKCKEGPRSYKRNLNSSEKKAFKIHTDLCLYGTKTLDTSAALLCARRGQGFESRRIPGGALGYFLGGYVPPGTPNWHPVLEKISPKIDTPF